MEKKKIFRDAGLFFVLLLLALGLFFLQKACQKPGAEVVVLVDEKEVFRVPLSSDATYEIETPEGKNTLTVQNGEARITYSDCRDHICERMGPISMEDQVIVCLPHRVVVQIEGVAS